MPVYNRQSLRRTLGQVHVRDTHVARTTASSPAGSGNSAVDAFLADPGLSGRGLYDGAVLRAGSYDYRIASFNTASGAFVSLQTHGLVIHSGTEYEVHETVHPADKDRCIDDAVKRLRVRREVPVAGVADLHDYAMPDGVIDVLDAYYFSSPSATLDRVKTRLDSFEPVVTASRTEIRISPAIGGSAQLVLDAIVTPTLGAGDAATVNVPDERLVLYAAEAKCWDLLARKAPRGTADEYRRLRDEAARQFTLLASRYKVPIDRPLRLDEAY